MPFPLCKDGWHKREGDKMCRLLLSVQRSGIYWINLKNLSEGYIYIRKNIKTQKLLML